MMTKTVKLQCNQYNKDFLFVDKEDDGLIEVFIYSDDLCKLSSVKLDNKQIDKLIKLLQDAKMMN